MPRPLLTGCCCHHHERLRYLGVPVPMFAELVQSRCRGGSRGLAVGRGAVARTFGVGSWVLRTHVAVSRRLDVVIAVGRIGVALGLFNRCACCMLANDMVFIIARVALDGGEVISSGLSVHDRTLAGGRGSCERSASPNITIEDFILSYKDWQHASSQSWLPRTLGLLSPSDGPPPPPRPLPAPFSPTLPEPGLYRRRPSTGLSRPEPSERGCRPQSCCAQVSSHHFAPVSFVASTETCFRSRTLVNWIDFIPFLPYSKLLLAMPTADQYPPTPGWMARRYW